jgi:6-phosphogluconate dehydrogenase
MQVGMVGLGRMGMNMARRLLRGGHEVVAYNRSPDKVREIAAEGATGVSSLGEMADRLRPPRAAWIMLPAGKPVDAAVGELADLFSKGDTIVDGANGDYRDDVRRAVALAAMGIHHLDAGVSGGIWGLENGYCLMVGGDEGAYRGILPLLETLAPPEGVLHCGPSGSGHFVKMVHNGIEYGMMSAYGEGFDLLQASPFGDTLDLAAVARLWNHGSVVRSWLLELAADALAKDWRLEGIQGYVEDSGEGRWTVREALASSVPAPVITAALYQRFRSRGGGSFSDRLLAALRNEFGGHAVRSAEKEP